MKTTSNTHTLRRFASVLATVTVLALIALTPAYLVSLVLPGHLVEPIESTNQVANIDIDRNGTVMYTVSPSYRQPGFGAESLMETLRGSDLIKVTVRDSDSSSYRVDHEASEGCGLTLQLISDDRYDAGTKTYVGYIRVEDREFETVTPTNINCALKFVEIETDYDLEPVDLR